MQLKRTRTVICGVTVLVGALVLLSGCGPKGSASGMPPFPEPFSSLHLGMDEADFRAARPNAKQDDDAEGPWTYFSEEFPSEDFVEYVLEDLPDGNRQLVAFILCGCEYPGDKKMVARGRAQRHFEVIRWGVVLDVRAWESDGDVILFSTIGRSLDPSATARKFYQFVVFRREAAERNPVLGEDFCKGFLTAIARSPDEDAHPVVWVDSFPETNRIERYVTADDHVISKECGDAILALVSDYDTFAFSIEKNGRLFKNTGSFVGIAFSGPTLDVDDPKVIDVSRDGTSLRVADADCLLFSIPEPRRETLRRALDRVVAESIPPLEGNLP